MTNYLASRPDFAELAKLETSTATLRRNALTAYDAHRAELARLDDPRDREHRDLDGSERVAARLVQALRAEENALFAQVRQFADAAFDLLPRRLCHPRDELREVAWTACFAWLRQAVAEQRG